MPFLKKGTPQPMKIASGLCENCNTKKASVLHDGKMICSKCKKELASSKE